MFETRDEAHERLAHTGPNLSSKRTRKPSREASIQRSGFGELGIVTVRAIKVEKHEEVQLQSEDIILQWRRIQSGK
jgi:hypothetical protein